MKDHYINILLFALALSILVYNQWNHKSTTPRRTKTNRSLCECELYAPVNYDSDPQMKEVMDNFNKQTQQRFQEYDERMKTTRQKCKDKCDKEIQKIILKDKLEKELMDKFSTLDTDIQSDAIPTCICEKSIADKVEKGCLRCGGVLGGGVAPSVGLLGGLGTYAWKTAATAAATKYATEKGIEAGIKMVIGKMKDFPGFTRLSSIVWSDFINGTNYNSTPGLMKAANAAMDSIKQPCIPKADGISMACNAISKGETMFSPVVEYGEHAYTTKVAAVKEAQEKAIETTFMGNQTAIIASVVAIVVIVLIMVIIYLILRHRRKKKMKKKLQYIKLLEE